MEGDGPSDELQEIEEELVTKKGDSTGADDDAEGDIEADSKGKSTKGRNAMLTSIFGVENLKVVIQAFTLTFLAEWGKYKVFAT